MSDRATEQSSDLDSSPGDLNALLERLRFANVYALSFEGKRMSSEDAESFHVRIHPKYLVVGTERIDYLFNASCVAFSDDEEDIAKIDVSYVATFDITDGSPVHEDAAQKFGMEVGLLAAYPYIREAVQAFGSRLGLPNLTMDIIRRNQPLPAGLSIGPLDDDEQPSTEGPPSEAPDSSPE